MAVYGARLERTIDHLTDLLAARKAAMLAGDLETEMNSVVAVQHALMSALDDVQDELGEDW